MNCSQFIQVFYWFIFFIPTFHFIASIMVNIILQIWKNTILILFHFSVNNTINGFVVNTYFFINDCFFTKNTNNKIIFFIHDYRYFKENFFLLISKLTDPTNPFNYSHLSTMFFFDDEEIKKVSNCPSCSATFIKDKGANCLDNCSNKQLENKHKKVIFQIINYCLPGREIKINCPLNIPIGKIFSRGWTYYAIGEINIPWYTLRNKKRFLHCIAHEVGHITDYEKKFTIEERRIIRSYFLIQQQKNKSFERTEKERLLLEMEFYKRKHQRLFNKWKKFHNELHSRIGWYQEYLKHHKNLINSPWRKYAYDNFVPLTYEQFLKLR